jgi:signal transduction histidine kinase
MAEGLVTVDAAGRLLTANRAAVGMFRPAPGGAAATVDATRHCLWPRLRDAGAVAAALARADGAARRRMIGRRGDGETFFAAVAVSRVLDAEAPVFIATIHDVTAVVRAERAARRRERALRAMTVRAEAATRAKSQFVATMSHELRTPLNAIIGFSAILEDGDEVAAETRVAFAREIRAGGERLLKLLTMVLDYAEADLDRGVLARAPTDLCGLLRDAVALRRPHAAAAGLELTLTAPETPLVLDVDAVAIAKSVDAVVGNAIRFTEKGGAAVTLRAAGGGAEIRVSDTGPGMPADFLRRCCEPFEQRDQSSTRRFEGGGLGLTVARGFVQRHGGALRVASAPGLGTTVTITLPGGADA